MAVRYNGRYSADNGATWQTWFSGVTTLSRAVPAVPGALRLQGQAYDDTDVTPVPTAWAEITLTVQAGAGAASAPVVAAEIEVSSPQVSGGAWIPYPNADRLAATRLRGTVPAGVPSGGTFTLRGRWRDLSDASAPTAWVVGPSYTVARAVPAPVTTLAALPPMRGMDAVERALLASRRRITHWRDEIQDDDGAWRELGTLEGEDFRIAGRVTDSPSDPVVRAALELWLEVEQQNGTVLSVAPLKETSLLNVRQSDGTYAPLIQRGRGYRRFGAVLEPGENPAASDWVGVFRGYLDDPRWDDEALHVTARDPASRLQDRMIRVTRTYGAPEAEGGVWLADVMRQVLADNGFADEVLCVVGTLNRYHRPFEVQRGQTVWQALETLATQIGWVLRYEWTSRTTLQLCLYAPQRGDLSTATPIFTLTPDRYISVGDFRTDSDGVRGRVITHFRNAATGEMDSATAEDAAALALFPDSTMEQVFENSEIDTPAEGQTASDLALEDTKRPLLYVQITVLENIGLRRGDVVALDPNFVHHDTPQRLAVYELAHGTPQHERRTVVTLVGRHMGAHAQWLAREAPPSPALGVLSLRVRAQEVGRDATSVLVKLTGEVARGGVPTGESAEVAITDVAAGAAILEGPALGVRAPSGTVWRIAFPPEGSGSFAVLAELPGMPGTFAVDRYAISVQGIVPVDQPTVAWRTVRLSAATVRLFAAVSDPGARLLTLGVRLRNPDGTWPAVYADAMGTEGDERYWDLDATGRAVLQAEWRLTYTATDGSEGVAGAVLTLESAGAERAWIGLAADGRSVHGTAAVIADTFPTPAAVGMWASAAGAGSVSFLAADGVVGPGAMLAVGEAWRVLDQSLAVPFDPSLLYRMRVWYLVDSYGGAAGPPELFAGIAAFDVNGTLLNFDGDPIYNNAHWVCSSGEAIPFGAAGGGYVMREGWFRGHGAGTVNARSVDPRAPVPLHPAVRTFVPLLALNLGMPAGAQVLVDAVLIEAYDADASRRLYNALSPAGDLNPGVGQSDGVVVHKLGKGLDAYDAPDGQYVPFAKAYGAAPKIVPSPIGGISYQPVAAAWSNGYAAGAEQYSDVQALDVDAAGFTARARLRQRAPETARTHTMAPASIDAAGETMQATVANAPSANDEYIAACTVTLTAEIGPYDPSEVELDVAGYAEARVELAFDTFDDAAPVGSQWTQRATAEVVLREDFDDTSAGTVPGDPEPVERPFSVAGMTAGDAVRIRIASFTTAHGGSVTVSAGSVRYTTSAGDSYASMTPRAGDRVRFFVFSET